MSPVSSPRKPAFGSFSVAVGGIAPAEHIDGVVIHQLQLGSELRNVVAGAGTCGQQFTVAAPEAVQRRLGPNGGRIGDLITLVQNELDLLVVELEPLLDLPAEVPHLIEGHDHKVSGPDAVKVLQPLHEHIGDAIVL